MGLKTDSCCECAFGISFGDFLGLFQPHRTRLVKKNEQTSENATIMPCVASKIDKAELSSSSALVTKCSSRVVLLLVGDISQLLYSS